MKEKLLKQEKDGGDNLDELKKTLADLEKSSAELEARKKEVAKEEKAQPLNVDTLSSPGFSKSIINTAKKGSDENLSEEEKEKRMKKFVKENEKLIKEYGMLQKFD